MNTTTVNSITHPELVKALCKPGDKIADYLNDNPNELYLLLQEVFFTLTQGKRLEKAKKRTIYEKLDAFERQVPDNIRSQPILSPEQAHLLHMAVGIAGESIELLELVFDQIQNNMPLDTEKINEELGDLAFYQEGFRQGVELSADTPLQHNINKLSKRYAGLTYSDQAAQTRADKA